MFHVKHISIFIIIKRYIIIKTLIKNLYIIIIKSRFNYFFIKL